MQFYVQLLNELFTLSINIIVKKKKKLFMYCHLNNVHIY